MAIICPKCGKEIDSMSKFCPECGAAIITPSATTPSPPKSTKKRRNKWPLITILILLAAVIGFLSFTYFRADLITKTSIIPYGVHWGDVPEIVMIRDSNAKPDGVNGKGELTYKNETIYGKYFNMKNDAIKSPTLLYRFQNNKLCGIIYTCAINTSVISSDDFIDGIIEYYFGKFGFEPDFKSFEYVWRSKECTVEVCYLTDDFFVIEYNP